MLPGTTKEEITLRYWKASLAWKNIGGWSAGWTTQDFIAECRQLAQDMGRVGLLADSLLDDCIHDVERRPLGDNYLGEVIQLRQFMTTNNNGLKKEAAQ